MSRTPHFQTSETAPGARIDHETSLTMRRIVVGYRDDDPRRYGLPGDIRGGVVIGRCVDCGHEVYGDGGAAWTVRERDTQVGCMWCHEQLVHVERFHQSGLVAGL